MTRAPAKYPKRKTKLCEFCGEVVTYQRTGTGAVRLHRGKPFRDARGRPIREYAYMDSHECPGLLADRARRNAEHARMVRQLNALLSRMS